MEPESFVGHSMYLVVDGTPILFEVIEHRGETLTLRSTRADIADKEMALETWCAMRQAGREANARNKFWPYKR